MFNTTEELNAYLEGCAFKQNDIIDIIDDIPTAYDVEKVVAELEGEDRKANQYRIDAIALHNEEFWRGRQTGLLKAIELIRNGGKE